MIMARRKNATNSNALFWQAAAGLRERFADTYGGIRAARAMLERGLRTFSFPSNDVVPDDLRHTACRLWRAQHSKTKTPFRMAFGGYSVTAGRGNYHAQSYPLVMERQLHTVFQLLGIDLEVRNAAIGGCPSFPYGWCLRQFLGHAPDVVSWDFSMNEAGGDPVGLEAYLRHVLTQFGTSSYSPKLIVKDTHLAVERRRLLQYYYNASVSSNSWSTARDPVVLHTDPAAQPFLELPESDRPVGFQSWRQFGAPKTAPGQSLHHPAVQEHELNAWLLTMHFLSALEYLAVASDDDNMREQCRASGIRLESEEDEEDTFLRGADDETKRRRHAPSQLPEPLYKQAVNSTQAWTSILFGEKAATATTEAGAGWHMNPVHCRTSFDPIVAGNLTDLVVSGTEGEDLDIMLPKSKMFYNRNWVLDLSDEEKKAKRNLNRFGGLGFVDSKKAYYGIYASGTLQFLLPYESFSSSSHNNNNSENENAPAVGDKATDWFKSVVICEVNEKRSVASACQTERDVQFTVGGVNATKKYATLLDAPGTVYLGKKLCTHLVVPEDARLTSRREIVVESEEAGGGGGTTSHVRRPPPKLRVDGEEERSVVGLLLTATIHNQHIVRREEACSISHVVWEQQLR